jgi:hypothetical protein
MVFGFQILRHFETTEMSKDHSASTLQRWVLVEVAAR